MRNNEQPYCPEQYKGYKKVKADEHFGHILEPVERPDPGYVWTKCLVCGKWHQRKSNLTIES